MFRFLAVAFLFLCASAEAAPANGIKWEPWSDAVFERAKREHRFVLMDLEAVWCHWCHVMEETTYRDPTVAARIAERYIAVRVDQDARPDISRRYEDYGWPATVVFNADGGEIVKRRGYLRPEIMLSMLDAVIADPSPVKYAGNEAIAKFADSPLLGAGLSRELERRYLASHDAKLGGFDQSQKFMDRDTMEYALLRAAQGDAASRAMARRTLDGALKLIDPAWGGAYQYSTDADWDHPHFEKIMSVQAEYLRLYALAYAQLNDARYLKAARDIHRYVKNFLTSPEGAFYTSQDADLVRGEHGAEYFALGDAPRRALGVPVVDRNRYARENGWMIQALANLYTVTGERAYLNDALAATRWITSNRALAGGGFRHAARDSAGPYLEDNLSMARAFLSLYLATAERKWLVEAERSAAFIDKHFRDPKQPGYLSSVQPRGSVLKPKVTIDENVLMARFANLLHRYTGNQVYRASAERAMRFLATEQVALSRLTDPGILLAGFELANDPLHITIVGRKDDPQALALYRAATQYPAVYRRIEWWDKREGKMPNPDVQYPSPPRAAAFICTDGSCSLPIFKAGDVGREVERAVGRLASAD